MDFLKLLKEMGYELAATGENSFPCAVTKDNVPLGFINENLEISCIPGAEKNMEIIQTAIEYSKENFGRFKVFENNFLISQHLNYFLSSSFDINEKKPIYHIHKQSDRNGVCEEIFNGTSKKEVVMLFVENSGLGKEIEQTPNCGTIETNAEVKIPEIKQEMDNLKQAPTEKIMNEPNPFQKLKDKLQVVKIKLKFLFSHQGIYGELSKENQSIGAIDNNLNVVFSPNVSENLQNKIESVFQEIKNEIPMTKTHVSVQKKKFNDLKNSEKPSIRTEIQKMKQIQKVEPIKKSKSKIK